MNKTSFQEHRELGNVAWLRNFHAATEASAESGKPIFLLFQEVPGCATCVNYGQDVLAHPLMVDMIHEHFVPLAIFNNHKGHDEEILRRYNEPSWNNPVVHIVDADGADILPKVANRYDAIALHMAMTRAVQATGNTVPEYFQSFLGDLLIEYGVAKTLTYNTPCFWSGETSLAQHPAVLTTDAGWVGGDEVVKITYDPREATEESLDAFAREQGFTRSTGRGFRLDREPQFYLRKSDYRYLPLTAVQRTKINVAVPYRNRPERWLSPTQAALAADPNLRKNSSSDRYRDDIRTAWSAVPVVAAS